MVWFITAELVVELVGGIVLVAMDTELVLVGTTVADGLVLTVVLVGTADVVSIAVADEVGLVMEELEELPVLLSVDSNLRVVEFTVRLAAALKKGLSDDGSLVVGSPCTLANTTRITTMTPWCFLQPLLLTDIFLTSE